MTRLDAPPAVTTMRQRFVDTAIELLDDDLRTAIVLADISSDAFAGAARRYPNRVLNVGIREQLMASVAGGLALTGMRPIVHSYAPFVVSRAYEQLKLDLGHQDVGAVVVSIGASYDSATSGATHFAPEDVALIGTLPGWQIHVPAYLDQVAPMLRDAVTDGGRHYIRLTENDASRTQPWEWPQLHRGRRGVVVSVGPTAAAVREAVDGLDVTVLPMTTVRPFDGVRLREAVRAATPNVVLVEPYLVGTSAHEVAAALVDVPHRVLSLGVGRRELRKYGTAAEHDKAHGLDAASLRQAIAEFVGHRIPDGE